MRFAATPKVLVIIACGLVVLLVAAFAVGRASRGSETSSQQTELEPVSDTGQAPEIVGLQKAEPLPALKRAPRSGDGGGGGGGGSTTGTTGSTSGSTSGTTGATTGATTGSSTGSSTGSTTGGTTGSTTGGGTTGRTTGGTTGGTTTG